MVRYNHQITYYDGTKIVTTSPAEFLEWFIHTQEGKIERERMTLPLEKRAQLEGYHSGTEYIFMQSKTIDHKNEKGITQDVSYMALETKDGWILARQS